VYPDKEKYVPEKEIVLINVYVNCSFLPSFYKLLAVVSNLTEIDKIEKGQVKETACFAVDGRISFLRDQDCQIFFGATYQNVNWILILPILPSF
jgi:hypothetical protein